MKELSPLFGDDQVSGNRPSYRDQCEHAFGHNRASRKNASRQQVPEIILIIRFIKMINRGNHQTSEVRLSTDVIIRNDDMLGS